MKGTETRRKILRMGDIHQTAIIHPQAKIAKNVEIGPYTTIGPHVEINEGTYIGPHVTVEGYTTIGKNNKIYHGAALGVDAQTESPEKAAKTYLFLGDNNIIRENVTIISGAGETRLGNGNLIMAYCHLACDCQIGNYVIMSNAANLEPGVIVEDHAVVAGLSVIHQSVRIGKISMVGAHSRVINDVPPYVIADGSPAHVSGINVIGLRRNGIKPALRREIKRAYKILYRSELTIGEAITKMDQKLDASEEIEHFLRFLRNVQKGICR